MAEKRSGSSPNAGFWREKVPKCRTLLQNPFWKGFSLSIWAQLRPLSYQGWRAGAGERFFLKVRREHSKNYFIFFEQPGWLSVFRDTGRKAGQERGHFRDTPDWCEYARVVELDWEADNSPDFSDRRRGRGWERRAGEGEAKQLFVSEGMRVQIDD